MEHSLIPHPEPPDVHPAIIRYPAQPVPARYASEHIIAPEWELKNWRPLDELLGSMWRRKYLILLVALLGLAAGFGISQMAVPIYQARTSLELEGLNDNYLSIKDVSPTLPGLSYAADGYVGTQARLLQSDTLLLRVGSVLGMRPVAHGSSRILSWVRAKLKLPEPRPLLPNEALLKEIRANLTIRTALQSRIVEILYRSPDSQFAADFANTLANEYVAQSLEERWTTAQDTTERLTRQLADLKSRLEVASSSLTAYARGSSLTLTGGQNRGTLAEERIRQLQAELSAAQADRISKQAIYEAAQHSSEESLPPTIEASAMREYQVALSGLRRQLAEVSTTLTPDHPKRKRLEAEIADLLSTIRRERSRILNRLQEDYESARKREAMLEAPFEAEARIVAGEAPRLAQYAILKHEVDTTQALYDSMLQKAKEAGIVSALRASNIRIIDRASAPSVPFQPNFPLNCGIGLLSGLFVSMFGVVVLDGSGGSIRGPGDAARIINVPELGLIPSAEVVSPKVPLHSIFWRNSQPLELVTWTEKVSLMAESFRAVLASLLFSNADGSRRRVIVITSLTEMEGKTTTTTNVALALAETRRRVLIIDGDLRRPRLHEVFNVCNSSGLVDFLNGSSSIADTPAESLALPTGIPNLWVMPSGPGAESVSNLFYLPTASQLMERVRKEFDMVLIDTPPLLSFSDARALGRLSDGVVLVVRANKASRQDLAAGYQRLMGDHITVIGTVLNDCPPRRGAAAGYGYYRYQSS